MTTTAGDHVPALLLFGATGQVGLAVRAALGASWRSVAPPRSEVSLDDPARLATYVRASGADAVVNAAAYTRVDDAEQDVERVHLINAAAPAAMAAGCAVLGARFIHLSTDYVFDGSGSLPYAPDAAPQPLNFDGLLPISCWYKPCVTSVSPTRMARLRVTKRAGPSSPAHSPGRPAGQPTVVVPAGTNRSA